ncbi:MAG TPA: hypothetical protein VN285_09220 [Candidatus Deferrimicrobium sp.]|nr:hypothetical protein [Candidatus Deferrimicrobium sp.]
MEIEFIYSNQDPRQAEARDFLRRFLRERGVLANIVESEQPVKSPTVIVDGQALKDERRKARNMPEKMYPATSDIARFLEKHLWGAWT